MSSDAIFPFEGLDTFPRYGWEKEVRDKIGVDLPCSTIVRAGVNLVETVNPYAILYSKDARREYTRQYTMKQRKDVIGALRNQPPEIFHEVNRSIA